MVTAMAMAGSPGTDARYITCRPPAHPDLPIIDVNLKVLFATFNIADLLYESFAFCLFCFVVCYACYVFFWGLVLVKLGNIDGVVFLAVLLVVGGWGGTPINVL